MPYTCRLLVDPSEAAVLEKPFAHVTAGYLGEVASEANLETRLTGLFEAHSTKDAKALITGTVMVGPKRDLLAYTVDIVGVSDLANAIWDQFGQLEPWQKEAGLTKGYFQASDDGSGKGYCQTYHITIGRETPDLQAKMDSYIGAKLKLAALDVKQTGPHDPLFSHVL